jgi:hypothetical protein
MSKFQNFQLFLIFLHPIEHSDCLELFEMPVALVSKYL